MRAIVVRQFGPPEVMQVEDVPDPAPQGGQVLVRIKAAGVNPVDTYIRSGNYARKPPLPYIPGFDGSGVVEATGAGADRFRPGQRVYFAAAAAGLNGAYAGMVVCDEHNVHALPDRVSFEQGAGVNTAYATAARALVQRAAAQPGEWVLVHGASGGVGTAAVQMARALGMQVIGTAGTPEGLDLVRREGAHHAVNHKDPNYLDAVMQITGGRGADVILEMLANVNLEKDLTVVALRGRIAVVGNRGTIEIDPRKAMSKDAAILGVQLGLTPADDLRRLHAFIGAGLANGTLTPVVGRTFPLADAAKAHVAVMDAGAKGKIVLLPL